MRMKEAYEAYLDDYNCLNVYISKNFFEGKSRIFHLKDTHDRIIPLTIQSRSDLYNGYTHYQLSLNGALQMGEEYTLYDEHCQTTVVRYSHIVKTERFNEQYNYEGDDLGLTYSKEQSIFKLWSPIALQIVLCLKNGGEAETYPMHREEKGVFSVTVHKDLLKARYTFMVRVNGKWNEIVDPYTSFSGPNAEYSVVYDKSLLHLPPRVPMAPLADNVDAIIYEASVRDMTSANDIGVENPKKFKGFTEENENTRAKNTGFSYLRSLGVTHVQLLPVCDFGSVDEVYPNIFYNWGYDPVQFRCLEGSYSTDPRNAVARIEEFAQLVHNCHKAGLRVNLDIVFNHVYKKEEFSLEKLVPNYYFLMNREGEFSNGSFCGNDIDSQPPMARKYLVETCRRLIEWFDVDGFRFDLMGILDIHLMNEITQVCRKMKPGFMIYGEGWNMPSFVPENLRASQINQAEMPFVGHFSDSFRETVRGSNADLNQQGYSNGNFDLIYSMMDRMSASGNAFNAPGKVINYVECHDNHTLWDKNRVACHGEGRDVREKRQVLANAMVLLSQGVPFLHAGQEFGRTKQNLGNTYNRSDNYNSINYIRRDHHISIVTDTIKLISIRRKYSCFRLRTVEETRDQTSFQTIENRVLVYICESKEDKCISFFNPSNGYYTYNLDHDVQVIFDNGSSNTHLTRNIQIAPYSVIVCDMMKQSA
ncbi:MAG: type I pullulanase [Catenisphaera adipataccumulans]|jgi:pullulanase|uniref:type I pullulanase n=1 Tax=Catenisphaera adipataccumulans TaxID=700500 RepID=UPI003D8C71F5